MPTSVSLTLFLQLFLIISIVVVVGAISVVLSTFARTAKSQIGSSLTEKEASSVAAHFLLEDLLPLEDISRFVNASLSPEPRDVNLDVLHGVCKVASCENTSLALCTNASSTPRLLYSSRLPGGPQMRPASYIYRNGRWQSQDYENSSLLEIHRVFVEKQYRMCIEESYPAEMSLMRISETEEAVQILLKAQYKSWTLVVNHSQGHFDTYFQSLLHTHSIIVDKNTGVTISSLNKTFTLDNSTVMVNVSDIGRLSHDSHFIVYTSAEISRLSETLDYGTRMMLLVTAAITMLICAAGSLFQHVLLRPLFFLTKHMMQLVSESGTAPVENRRSFVREFCVLQSNISKLAYFFSRAQLPRSSSSIVLKAALESKEDVPTESQTFTTHVSVVYESRTTSKVKATGNFDFTFSLDPDPEIFNRFSCECKTSCKEDEFESVTLTIVNERNEYVLLRNSIQLHEMLSLMPKQLDVAMTKSNWPLVGVFVTGAVDVLNCVVTLVFAFRLFGESDDKTPVYAFVGLYFFALSMNFVICVALQRSGSDAFRNWLQVRTPEVVVCCILGTLNTQNLQVIWSSVDFLRLRFNAPTDPTMLQRSISWSMFGFLFSDVTQLLFKVWKLYNSGTVDVLYFFAIATSGVSVLFNLVFKLHAVFLWSSGNSGEQTANDSPLAAEHLVQREVTIVSCTLEVPAYVKQMQLRAVEYNAFYTRIASAVREYQGVILAMHAGTVTCSFNVHRKDERHADHGLSFACYVQGLLEAKGQAAHFALVSKVCSIGMLGPLSDKRLHCFGCSRRIHHLQALSSACSLRVVADASIPAFDEDFVTVHFARDSRYPEEVPSASASFLANKVPDILDDSTHLTIVSAAGDEKLSDVRARQLAVAIGVDPSNREDLLRRASLLWKFIDACDLGSADFALAMPSQSLLTPYHVLCGGIYPKPATMGIDSNDI